MNIPTVVINLNWLKKYHNQDQWGGYKMLEIKKKTNGKEMIIGLAGSLDTTTSSNLEVVIQSELSNIETLIFDIIDLDYISSAGLRVMLLAQKIMNKQGKMIVKNVSSKIMEIFEVTGFADALTIE